MSGLSLCYFGFVAPGQRLSHVSWICHLDDFEKHLSDVAQNGTYNELLHYMYRTCANVCLSNTIRQNTPIKFLLYSPFMWIFFQIITYNQIMSIFSTNPARCYVALLLI